MSDDMRIVVIVTDAHPELREELNKISPRGRAERLRSLATLGVSLNRHGYIAQLGTPAVLANTAAQLPEAETKAKSAQARPARARTLKSPGASLSGAAAPDLQASPQAETPPDNAAETGPAGALEDEPSPTLKKKAKSPGFNRFIKSVG